MVSNVISVVISCWIRFIFARVKLVSEVSHQPHMTFAGLALFCRCSCQISAQTSRIICDRSVAWSRTDLELNVAKTKKNPFSDCCWNRIGLLTELSSLRPTATPNRTCRIHIYINVWNFSHGIKCKVDIFPSFMVLSLLVFFCWATQKPASTQKQATSIGIYTYTCWRYKGKDRQSNFYR